MSIAGGSGGCQEPGITMPACSSSDTNTVKNGSDMLGRKKWWVRMKLTTVPRPLTGCHDHSKLAHSPHISRGAQRHTPHCEQRCCTHSCRAIDCHHGRESRSANGTTRSVTPQPPNHL